MPSRLRNPMLLAAAMFLVGVYDAHAGTAYIDPNTGGMLFQLLAVVFTFVSGIIVFFSSQIRTAVARLRRLLRGRGDNGVS